MPSIALALKLIAEADCKEGGHVLGSYCRLWLFLSSLVCNFLCTDVGYGSGESLLLHLRHPSVPRPAHLTGVTSLEAHYKRSQDKVRHCQEDLGVADNVTLYHGDAVFHRDPWADASLHNHPLDPEFTGRPYTSILALDCAYHFKTRHEFLEQSYSALADGGKIALGDICFSFEAGKGVGSFLVRSALTVFGFMPRANMVTVEQYVEDMYKMGYKEVKVEDISSDVFPGFTEFLGTQGVGWSIFAKIMRRVVASGAQFVIVSGRR